jgi:hypothetical protein
VREQGIRICSILRGTQRENHMLVVIIYFSYVYDREKDIGSGQKREKRSRDTRQEYMF